jgi:transposase-like protein
MAVAYARSREREGASVHRAARELGLPMTTLQSWMRASTPAFRRVTIEAAPDHEVRLVVRTPSGLIVEGLDVAGVAELSRALSPR